MDFDSGSGVYITFGSTDHSTVPSANFVGRTADVEGTVSIIDDNVLEDMESITVFLDTTSLSVIGFVSQTVTILDNEGIHFYKSCIALVAITSCRPVF